MIDRWNEENLKELVKESNNKAEVIRKLGLKIFHGNYNTFDGKIRKYKIDTSHFKPYNIEHNKTYKKYEMSDILIENSTYLNNGSLKKRLYKEALKERVCEKCGQTEDWNGEHISLILDHINGKNNDHRIENLRIVCPNCNATLPTHCGKNIKSENLYKKVEIKKCSCGNLLSGKNKSGNCSECVCKKRRKVERPSYKQLMKEIEELGYSGTGRKYGVHHNTIKDWQNVYENKTNAQLEYHKRIRRKDRPSYNQLINEIKNLGYSGTGRKYGVSDNSIRKWEKYYEKYEQN